MNKIILENGSEVKTIESTSTFRSKRSELISFYCANCVRNIISKLIG